MAVCSDCTRYLNSARSDAAGTNDIGRISNCSCNNLYCSGVVVVAVHNWRKAVAGWHSDRPFASGQIENIYSYIYYSANTLADSCRDVAAGRIDFCLSWAFRMDRLHYSAACCAPLVRHQNVHTVAA